MALPGSKRDILQAIGGGAGGLVCNEALDDAAFTSPPKRSKASTAPGAGKQPQRQQPDGEPCVSTSGRATLQVEAGDYECSICLQILVDPVVGEGERIVAVCVATGDQLPAVHLFPRKAACRSEHRITSFPRLAHSTSPLF